MSPSGCGKNSENETPFTNAPRITLAVQLLSRCERDHPGESPENRWARICRGAIPSYSKLSLGDHAKKA